MEIDPVILELKAKVDRYQADVRNATRTVDQQFGIQEKRAQRLEREMRRSSGQISSTIKGLAATLAAAFTGRELVGLLDSYTRFENALKVAGLEGQNLANVQERLFELANRNGVALEAVGTLYGRAAQSSRELGASQEDLLRFTEAVSASLRITGTSTEEASGALLQLGQALGSPRVQAEEFNSIIDTMRPLLVEAAKEIDGTGGSLAGLIQKLKDTKGPGVSNVELFNGITAAMERLRETADETTLTVAAGFTNLTSALTKYFGEADKANGVSVALGGALSSLADNIDILIPAIAIIATGLGVGYVTAAVQARIATLTLGAAAVGTGRALLVAFGGPVGIAITAVGVGLAYVASQSAKASAEAARLADVANQNAAEFGTMAKAANSAAGQLEELDDKQVLAAASAAGLKVDTEQLADAHYKAAVAARAQRIEEQRLAAALSAKEYRKAYAEARREAAGVGAGTGSTLVGGNPLNRPSREDVFNELLQSDEYKTFQRDLETLRRMRDEPVIPVPTGSGGSGSGSGSGSTKTRTARDTGPSEAEIAFRQAQELNRLRAEEIQAQLALTDDATERADLQRELLDLERNSRIADVRANADLSKEQQDAQIEILNRLFGVEASLDEQGNIIANGNRSLYAQAVERERLAQLEREQADLAAERYNNQVEALRLQYDLADTQAERRDIAFQILDAEDRYLKSKLEAIIASEAATEAEKERARIALEGLNATSGARREALGRAEAGPLQRYIDSMSDPATKAEEAVVRQLERVNDGITDAISKAIGTDDPFIKELLGILLEEILLKPLAQALQNAQGAGGGGGLLSGIGSVLGSIFGGARAAGGPVSPGSAYLVGERGRELFVPDAPGRIVPNSRLASSGGGGGVVRIVIDEAPGFATRVETVAQGVAIDVQRRSAPAVIEAAANETLRRASRPSL